MRFSTRLKAISCLLLIAVSTTACLAQGPVEPLVEHKQMALEVGVWEADCLLWMGRDSEPIKSKAIETNKMVGGMWLASDFESEFGGMKFVGHGQMGYDPVAKKYIGTWVDSMGPYLYTMQGSYDVATHTLTMITKGRNAQTGEMETTSNVTKYIDEDNKVFTGYSGGPDDKNRYKTMEFTYKRKK